MMQSSMLGYGSGAAPGDEKRIGAATECAEVVTLPLGGLAHTSRTLYLKMFMGSCRVLASRSGRMETGELMNYGNDLARAHTLSCRYRRTSSCSAARTRCTLPETPGQRLSGR